MSNVLTINCFKRDDYARDFDRAISRVPGDMESSVVRMSRLGALTDAFPFSHLIISGSETSALDDYPWTAHLEALVRKWVKAKKPILGICYGHQFLARVLAGISSVRRAIVPEFGWADISLTPCALFGKMKELTAMVSHYDEVCDLPEEDFTVFAKTPCCGIHGFQYRNLPVWGVQFHPEYKLKEAEYIFQQVRKSDPSAEKWFIGTPPCPGALNGCQQVFDNFLAL